MRFTDRLFELQHFLPELEKAPQKRQTRYIAHIKAQYVSGDFSLFNILRVLENPRTGEKLRVGIPADTYRA